MKTSERQTGDVKQRGARNVEKMGREDEEDTEENGMDRGEKGVVRRLLLISHIACFLFSIFCLLICFVLCSTLTPREKV